MFADDDENRHTPPGVDRWCEWWTFEFTAADGGLGGWARIGLDAGRSTGWYHAYLIGPDRPTLAVIDDDVPIPRGSLELRTEGLWADHICETPHDHWTIGLEAFALGVDDPTEVLGRAFGDRVPLGFDLEWEVAALADDGARVEPAGYSQAAIVSGEILVGDEQIDFSGLGHRDHRWGPVGWTTAQGGATWWADDGRPHRSTELRWSGGVHRDGSADDWEVAPVADTYVPLGAFEAPDHVLARRLCSFTRPGVRGFGWSDEIVPADRTTG